MGEEKRLMVFYSQSDTGELERGNPEFFQQESSRYLMISCSNDYRPNCKKTWQVIAWPYIKVALWKAFSEYNWISVERKKKTEVLNKDEPLAFR